MDPIELMQARLETVREERVRLSEQLAEHGARASAQYVAARAVDLARNDAVDAELTLLLRAAHGMNPNGSWPHPAGTCIECGGKVDDGEQLCGRPVCTERRVGR